VTDAGGLTPAPPPPPEDPPVPGPSPTPGLRLADWDVRLEAAVIDFFVRLGIVAACIALGALLYLAGDAAGAIGLAVSAGIGAILVWFVYAPLMLARTNGQTVGHRAASTRIVMADGTRMSGKRAFVREALVKGILIDGAGNFTFGIVPIVNYLFPLWDPNNEALHDKLCTTRVVMT
jgi:uncharacterized RDD family membrane protein YckC